MKHSWGRVSIAVLALAVAAADADAGGPTMSTATGSSATCGTPGQACVPGADVFEVPLAAAPVVVDLLTSFGLVAGDDVSSLSFGNRDLPGASIRFSVAPGAVGVAGAAPDVASEAAAGEEAADIFDAGTLAAPAPNALLVDGNGTITAPAGAFAATGLPEPSDDLDALVSIDLSKPTMLGATIYFTLAPGSPTLTALGASPAHVLQGVVGSGGPPAIHAAPGVLGLTVADAIDALAFDTSSGRFMFSLAPGSPALGLLGAGPADILRAPGLAIHVPAAALGLGAGDDIDALDIAVDPDGDLLQTGQDNCATVANNDQADGNANSIGDACEDSDSDGLFDPVDNCPIIPNPTQDDGDGDGAGDVCDRCFNAGARDMSRSITKLTKVNADATPGNEGFRLVGEFTNATAFAAIDPSFFGARVLLRNAAGGTEFEALLGGGPYTPGGVGWTLNPSGKVWLYRDKTAMPEQGIIKVKIIDQNAKSPNRVKVVVVGKKGNYPVVTADSPVTATIVLGDQTAGDAGQCGETAYAPANCAFNPPGTVLSCKLVP